MQIENRNQRMADLSFASLPKNAGRGPAASIRSLLTGPALTVVMTPGGPDGPTIPERTAVLLGIMNAHYRALSAIAKNMGVSDRERELRERQKKELKRKIIELERREDVTEQKLINIANTLVAAEDRELLDRRMAENGLRG